MYRKAAHDRAACISAMKGGIDNVKIYNKLLFDGGSHKGAF